MEFRLADHNDDNAPLVTLVPLQAQLSDLPAPLRPSGGRPKYPLAFDAFKAGSFNTAAIRGQFSTEERFSLASKSVVVL